MFSFIYKKLILDFPKFTLLLLLLLLSFSIFHAKNFNLDEVISGEKKIEYVDKLELLREKVNSKSVLSSRSNKKELIEIVENLIDLMPVELRTARWLVREQDTYLNKAREEANEILSIAKIESDRLIADSYVLQEAVIEANALIKKAEDEAQAYRAQIEDQIDAKLTEVLNKFEQINNFIETEKKSLRQPRKIVEPE